VLKMPLNPNYPSIREYKNAFFFIIQ